jgi:hypothetical protein
MADLHDGCCDGNAGTSLMSVEGQKATSKSRWSMPASPFKADIARHIWDVS